jgi:NAD(P)-dependent dehydrogenase (short-subunit alcohol dehydrogenase family)
MQPRGRSGTVRCVSVAAGRLEGKVALVTGGASGIGRATARRLRAAGATLAVADLADDAGHEAAAEVGGIFCHLDVGEPREWEASVSQIEAELGGLDIAFLNAGVTTGEADVAVVSDEQYRRIMRANVDGVFFGARAVVPALERRGGGAVVATASLAGLIAYSPDPVYALTKQAVVGFVRALAPQLEAKHITINAICPGLVDTPLIGDEGHALARAANFPLIAPEAIAEAVYDRVVGEETGQAFVCQAGREAIAYRFGNVPGPRGEAAGRTPPDALASAEEVRKSAADRRAGR